MFFELLLLYIFYVFGVVSVTYYINLFVTQEQYTRTELKSIGPWFKLVASSLSSMHTIPMVLIALLGSSFVAILLQYITYHWIVNSAIIFLIIFFILPYLKKI